MAQTNFAEPVFLKLHETGNYQVRSPHDALEYLDHLWPAERTAHYRQARVLCHSAIDGIVEPETARVALIDAACRAGVLASGREVDGVLSDTYYVAGGSAWNGQIRNDPDDLEVDDFDLTGYYRAVDIVDDPALSPSRKRALLAYWASDLHAVAGAPSLRCVRGVTITVDSILNAMCRLDAEIDEAAMAGGGLAAGRTW